MFLFQQKCLFVTLNNYLTPNKIFFPSNFYIIYSVPCNYHIGFIEQQHQTSPICYNKYVKTFTSIIFGDTALSLLFFRVSLWSRTAPFARLYLCL